jgi:hypothetical protein
LHAQHSSPGSNLGWILFAQKLRMGHRFFQSSSGLMMMLKEEEAKK